MVGALADLFATFEADKQRGGGRLVVAPTSLREALHALDAHKFHIGAAMPLQGLPENHFSMHTLP